MQIDYGKYGKLIANTIIDKLESRRHPLGKNNAYPFSDIQKDKGNFEQQCAKKRFNDLIVKFQEITNTVDMSPVPFAQALNSALFSIYRLVSQSAQLEAPHTAKLEKLAIDIVCKDFNIKPDEIIFNVKIKPIGSIEFPDTVKYEKEEVIEPPEISEDNYDLDIDDEVQKRQFINSLISGASKKGHYIFHLGKQELDEIDKNLIPIYRAIMSTNDLVYYIVGDESFGLYGDGSESMVIAGYERISFTQDGTPIITVEAVNFPTLLHEIIKAVVELIATLSLPDDKDTVDYVYDMADYINAETWYLRLGPVFWERLISCFPVEYIELKSQLLGKMFELPTDDFNTLMQSAISTDNQDYAISFFSNWGNIIKENIRDYNQRNS